MCKNLSWGIWVSWLWLWESRCFCFCCWCGTVAPIAVRAGSNAHGPIRSSGESGIPIAHHFSAKKDSFLAHNDDVDAIDDDVGVER